MTAPVDLCNMALGQLGRSGTPGLASITSLNPPSPANFVGATTAALYYQTQVDAVFRAAHWNSARVQVALTLLKAATGTPENPNGTTLPLPPIPWLYEYEYPDDCLLLRFVMPQPRQFTGAVTTPLMTNLGAINRPLVTTSMPFVPAIDKDMDGNQVKVILTNAQLAQGVYTGRIANPDLWDASLQNAVIGTLAAWFALPITGNKALTSMRVQLAIGLINAARMSDGNEGITTSDIRVDWMEARNVGAGWSGLFSGETSGPFIANWASIGMPDGVSY